MSFSLALFLLLIGLVIIIKGGDLFVDAAIELAYITGIPKILIGATLVSVATVLPEVLVSTMAVAQGASDMGIGTNLGSVICNTGLILGISIFFLPQRVGGASFTSKSLLILAAFAVLLFGSRDALLSPFEGSVLFLLFSIYIITSIREAKYAPMDDAAPAERGKIPLACIVKFIIGSLGIIIGARLLVNSGVAIANILGVPERIIGLTVLAIGTSLPELVTTLTAIAKKEFHLSIGNILGANLMNLVLIPALCSWIAPGGLPMFSMGSILGSAPFNTTVFFDLPMAFLLSLIVILPGLARERVFRWQGVLLLLLYVFYLLILAFG